MDSTSNEDASRILKGILNIGGRDSPENGPTLPSHENDDKLENGHEFATENITESIDSCSEVKQEFESFDLKPVAQFVNFTGTEQQGSVSIYGSEVHVTSDEVDSRQPVATGSNRVKINPVVNYDWKQKYYNGNLLSVSSKYMAYPIKGMSGYVLRILNRKTVAKTLIKGFTESIEDVSFAHYNSDQLACIDAAGDVFIWTISEDNDNINHTLKLHVKRKNEKLPEVSAGNRLVWCPYVVDNADDEEDEDVSEKVLAVSVGRVAEVFNIDMISKAHGDTVHVDDVINGIVKVKDGHTNFITDISLAPDGSVLATASEDGGVKFWQLNFESGDAPLCLHEWQPHEGQPVSKLMFCDNHLIQDDKSPFWRFLITSANHNSELKVWCTVTWSCLQTIRFKPPASNQALASPTSLKLKASLDLSAQYLVLSDIDCKVLYVFLLHQNIDEGKAHVTSVAHFILTQPLLSFVISEAKMFKASVRDIMDQNVDREGQEQDDDEHEDNEEDKPIPTIKIKLHCINPKAMQEMIVQYHPYASVRPVTPTSEISSSVTNTESGVQDGLSDVSGLDTSLTEEEDVEARSDSSTPKPEFETIISKPVKPVSQTGQDVSLNQRSQPELASVTSSITSVTSMNTSLPSTNIVQLLEKSQASVNECSFQTCNDVTLKEQSGHHSDSWLGHTSPEGGISLPESPDPAKVPFPVFKTERMNRASEDDNIPVVTHSTPLRRSSDQDNQDIDKTPTGDDEFLPKEEHILSSSPTRSSSSPKTTPDPNPPSEKSESLDFVGNVFGSYGSQILPEMEISMRTPVTGQLGGSNDDTKVQSDERKPQRNQRHANLTMTPRRQIDIQPEAIVNDQVLSAGDGVAIEGLRDEIRQLRQVLQNQQQEQNVKVSEVLREEVAILEGAISSTLETILAQHNIDQEQMFEKFTRDKQVNEKQRHEKMTTSITTAVLNKIEKTVKNEIRNSVGSSFQKIVPSLQEQLNTVMTQKLTVANEVMKESIAKIVKDRSILDAIGKAVSDAIQVTFLTTMNEFLNKSMLPGFEKACRAMYAQINTAFDNGTKQYIQNFESYAENRKDIEKQQKDNIVEQLGVLVKDFQAASEKLSTTMSGNLLQMMQTQLTSSMKMLQSSLLAQLQEDLNKSLQETIQKEVASALMDQSLHGHDHRDQLSGMKNLQLRIEQLIKDKDYDGAFQEALTASDLTLVLMVCQSCDPVELFEQDPCPLNQPILLSLIQQLSVDLSSDTELKHRYLKEALLALDTEDSVTKEHVTDILEGLCQQITITMRLLAESDSPSTPLQRELKRLLMEAKSLMK